MNRDAPIIPIAPKRAEAALRERGDDDLMALAAGGCAEAFDVLTLRHAGAVRAFCARMLGGPARGDDVAQEVFLEIWRARHRYEGRGRFRSFLFTAARNRCLRAIRDYQAPLEVDEPLADVDGNQLDTLLEKERRRRVAGQIENLSPKLREVVWLRFSAGLAFEDIAKVAKCPVETARSRVFLALQRLRQALGFDEGGKR